MANPLAHLKQIQKPIFEILFNIIIIYTNIYIILCNHRCSHNGDYDYDHFNN
jgi:hypothetical protein